MSNKTTENGRIGFVNEIGNYGFITIKNKTEDVYFHLDDCDFEEMPEEGEKVTIKIIDTQHGLQAKNIKYT